LRWPVLNGMKNILIVVGTRPNFIKVTQFRRVAAGYPGICLKIAHTGQHSDRNMSGIFFEQFGLVPDYFLDIDGTTPVSQMGQMMTRLEELISTSFRPDLIITPGDVNSTLAVALVANKMNIPLAHLESGLRSRDRTMPEEINRILTDEISDHYFVTEKSGMINLAAEHKTGKIHFVGNTMIDTLVAYREQIDKSGVLEQLGITGDFILVTMHRPATVDSVEGLTGLLNLLAAAGANRQIIFPIHPRTRKKIEAFGLTPQFESLPGLILTEPMGYFEFQKLVSRCRCVITDSGGVQEETTFMQVPCLTLRSSTERPVTIDVGSNTLVPFDLEVIKTYIASIDNGNYKKGRVPEFWDGKSTERIMNICADLLLKPGA
jgi:UDP-N-acetylglucosamine 2-epimerase (non-hydrolysing)